MEFLRHFPYALDPEGERISALTAFGCPGETVACSFSIVHSDHVPDVEISCSSLNSAGERIAGNRVEVYVVHKWLQSGLGIYQGAPIETPELLLKDDRQSLKDGYKRLFAHWRNLVRRRTVYAPPKLRLRGPVNTSLRANQPKQIFLSLRIPEGTPAGKYEGRVQIKARTSKHNLDLTVEVLPITLLPPVQDLMIFYKGTSNWRNTQHYVSKTLMRTQLQDIWDHGFRSITIMEENTAAAQAVIDLAESVGFDRHLVLIRPYPKPMRALHFRRSQPICFLSDEMDIHSKYGGAATIHEDIHTLEHITNWNSAREENIPTICCVYHQPFRQRMLDENDVGHAPDLFCYCLVPNRDYFYFRSNMPEMAAEPAYYYWSAHMEKPDLNRVLAGLYLWKSKANGISPYCYQHLPRHPFSPYDDFDPWEPGTEIGPVKRDFRDHLVTYPAQGGPVPTLQWEGLREGIIDLRYLTTLESVLSEAETSQSSELQAKASMARNVLESFLKRIDLRSIQIVSETEREPYPDIRPEEYHAFRRQLADFIIQLRAPNAVPQR